MQLSAWIDRVARGVNRVGLAGGAASPAPASLLPRVCCPVCVVCGGGGGGGMKTSLRPGALFAALLAASPLFSPDDARAQAMVCTPTQTVSAEAAANSLYTTTLTCADTSAAAGAADYRHLHYNHRAGPGLDPADRDTTLTNNNMGNNLALTISRGVIFTADGYADLRVVPTDAAILLYHAGAKSVTVEDGAVINLERTPRGYSATDPNRPASATTEYNPAWYHNFQSVVDELAAIAVRSRTTDGDADIAIRHDGVINVDIEMIGTYAEAPWSYGTNAGAAIEALVTEERRFGPFTRTDIDIDIDVGATGVIRHAEGTDGLNAIRAENASEDGDITIDLAEGSLIDVSEGGGYGVFAKLQLGGPVGQQRGDIIVNAAGTIKTAVKSRVWTRGRGMGIYAESEAHSGRVRIASSGTIETVQAAAIDARATRATNVQRDDPDTEEIEGHVVDVTGGTIETRGATAIYASISNYDSIANANSATTVSHMTVRVAEGATVRAQALTTEDYANGAIPQETLEASGRAYIDRGSSRWHGWRLVDVERTTDSGETETVKRLEPIITGIAVRDLSEVAAADAPRDQVFVDGTVETVGGKANVDPAIWLEGGGLVVVGANGRVGADSGLAISGGCSSDYRNLDYVPVDGVYATVDCDEVEARALEVRVAGTVDGDIRVLDEGVLSLASMEGGTVTGTVHDPAGPLTVAGRIGRLLYTSGGTVTVARTGALTGVEVEGRTEALRSEAGDLSLTVDDMGMVSGDVQARGGGRLTLDLKAGGAVAGTVHDPAGPLTVAGRIGRLLYTSGGTVTVARTGALTGVEVEGRTEALGSEAGDLSLSVDDMGMVSGDVQARGGGRLTLDLKAGGTVAGTVHDPAGPLTVAGRIGRLLYTSGGTVTVAATGALTGVEVEGRTEALGSEAGDLSLTVDDMGMVSGDVQARGGGRLTLDLKAGGAVAGTVHDPAGPLTVAGRVGRLLYTSGGTVTVARTGRLTGVEVEGETDAIRSEAGDLDLTVSGQVAGDLRAPRGGTLKLNVMEGGKVPGTVHDPVGPLTVAGEIGRLLYTSGGTVTVAATGRLTGVEGETEALRSAAGTLDVTVAGQVAGDLRAPRGGTLKLNVMEGGKVPGTVHDPVGPLTVAGEIGRLLYTNGGTVTVAATGRLTGVEGETEALRSAAGTLDLTVSGRVAGDLRAPRGGTLKLSVLEGGKVPGTVHDPAGPLTVAGEIGRLLYTSGGTVTVARTGALTGIEVEGETEAICSEGGTQAICSEAGDLALSVAGMGTVTGDVRALGDGDLRATVAGTLTGDLIEEGDGDLSATVSGTLTGDVSGLGAGEHVVTVSNGGTVTGTVHLAASTVGVDGRAGRVRFDNGGTVTVGGAGHITGIAVEDRTEAIRNEAGELVVNVAGGGRITGDVIDLGTRPARVTTGPGSTVEGSVDVAGEGSAVRVDGTVEGRVRYRRGGMLTVGPDGKVEGGASSDRGKIVAVVERKPEETEDEARERAFPGFPDSVVEGVEEEGGGRTPTIEVKPRVVEFADHEPRMRVYEALPSVVLGMNGLRGVRERMAVPRSAKGGWARVERFQGKWKADASASQKESGVGLRYRHQRHGVEVGLGGALGEEARIGASLHHRRGTAKVTEGGDVELYGTGAGVSGTWTREEDYLDVQAAMTWYEADLTSSSRGALRKDLSGHGHALGVEAGRRMALERLPAGVVLTPRVGLVHSRVSMDAFSDATGARVRVDDARSLKGRAGVDVETKPGGAAGSRVFASVEVEHEFSTDRKVRVSGTELKSEAEATWLRLGLNGVYAWEEGRYTVQGGVGYATSGGSHELGGGLSLNLRF